MLRLQRRDIVLSVVVEQRQPRSQVCEECRCGCVVESLEQKQQGTAKAGLVTQHAVYVTNVSG